MKIHKSGNTLRATLKTKILNVAISVICFFAGLVLCNLWNGFAFLALFGIVMLPIAIQYLVGRIVLEENRIMTRSAFSRKIIEREDIESVTWEKTARVILKLKTGKTVRIPDLGNCISVCNCVRAWLKETEKSEFEKKENPR